MLLLSRQNLIAAFAAANVPPAAWMGTGESIQGDYFGTVSREWMTASWAAAVAALLANAPRLVELRPIGGGKTQPVPRYVANGFNCRGHTLHILAHGLTGFADSAAAAPMPLAHDALACGWLHYTARPSVDNLRRDGRHRILWFIDHEGVFQTFEGGDGEENELTAEELASITYLASG